MLGLGLWRLRDIAVCCRVMSQEIATSLTWVQRRRQRREQRAEAARAALPALEYTPFMGSNVARSDRI